MERLSKIWTAIAIFATITVAALPAKAVPANLSRHVKMESLINLISSVSNVGKIKATAEDYCAPVMQNANMAEYRNCKARFLSRQSENLRKPACSAKTCLFKLASTSNSNDNSGVFRGYGYELTIAFNQRKVNGFQSTYYDGTLVDPQKNRTLFESECGAACNFDPLWISGAHRGATLTHAGRFWVVGIPK